MRFLRILERAIPLGQVVEFVVLIEKMFYHVKAERAIRFFPSAVSSSDFVSDG